MRNKKIFATYLTGNRLAGEIKLDDLKPKLVGSMIMLSSNEDGIKFHVGLSPRGHLKVWSTEAKVRGNRRADHSRS